jgi:hypothetical protein
MSLSSLYSDIVSIWISSEGKTNSDRPQATGEWVAGIRAKIVTIALELQALRQQTALAKWEGSIRGAWPFDEYMRLADEETRIMTSLSLVSYG